MAYLGKKYMPAFLRRGQVSDFTAVIFCDKFSCCVVNRVSIARVYGL
jgi:hypothetical protein